MIGLKIMAYRQIKRFLRAESRLIGTFLNPLIWLIFFGLGFSGVFSSPAMRGIFGGADYLSFLAPGIFVMTIFNHSFIAGVSVLWDKEFGFLKEVLVAPISRKEGIFGRILGDSLITLLQGAVILLLTFILAENLKIGGFPSALAVGLILAMAFSSLGVIVALKMESMEGFQMIMMIISLPLIFLSGAMYPLSAMPEWMRFLSLLNPLTYAVDATRYLLIGESASNFSPLLDIFLLLSLASVSLIVAMMEFEKARIG
ncbi:MAG: type transport system permease protein [Archaeoglobi archaeon]|nr:type transport system permease protein [Archaeoglobi archaeon]